MITQPAKRLVTYRFPFQLPGMDEPHAPGTFEVMVEEEQIDVVWAASRSSLTILLTYPGRIEAMPVSAGALEASILQDRHSAARADSPF
ncbi:hypothetical protein JP75_24595 [Devosia riboflavina]|uniref:Uncharacterized protein n=1 Tax=Devosia riboflavina TaxID=46914 RepID=A0A087LUY8_9HYPH|nr:hypothetical protein [Devosia riboflavina]KFL28441.1 hypothetical protein JP75_24595 [Devosia riboflavina]